MISLKKSPIYFLMMLILNVNIAYSQSVGGSSSSSSGLNSCLANIAHEESGTNPNKVNTQSTALGEFQMEQGAYETIGVLTQISPVTKANNNGNYTNVVINPNNQFGITNMSQLYLPQNQVAMVEAYLPSAYQTGANIGLTKYLGQTVDGQTINQSALLGCEYVAGPTGCSNFLASGGQLTPLGDNILKRMSISAPINCSQYTNGYNYAANSTGSGIPSGQANMAGYGMYCDQQVLQSLENSQIQEAQAIADLANNPTTGYTTMGSNSFGGNPQGFSQYTCLNNIFAGQSIFFSPPNWQQIISQLENAACSKIQNIYTSVVSPLSQDLSTTIPLNQIAPGLGLGGIPIGLQTNLNNSGGLQTNFGQSVSQFSQPPAVPFGNSIVNNTVPSSNTTGPQPSINMGTGNSVNPGFAIP